jgi:mono/diheme cytochrome c family protein
MRWWLAVAMGVWAAGCAEGDGAGVDAVLALTGDTGNGEVVFAANCASCHAADGTGGTGPNITGGLSADQIARVVVNGEDSMPSFSGTLSDQEMADVVAYVEQVL